MMILMIMTIMKIMMIMMILIKMGMMINPDSVALENLDNYRGDYDDYVDQV